MSSAHPGPRVASHAYLAVFDGEAEEMHRDGADAETAGFAASVIRAGGYLVRLPIAEARAALGQPWPAEAPAAAARLAALEDVARRVA